MKHPVALMTLALTLALTGLSPGAALACLWDRDTLEMEAQRFPDTLELITGNFLRHSRAFYEWRVKSRRARLVKVPGDLAALDDLAVALDKLGQHDEAIAIMMTARTLEVGRYETLANLGTFHLHAGHLEEGVKFIAQAIKVNPDAHFGREIYQKLLVEWILSAESRQPLKLPLAGSGGRPSFVDFLDRKIGRTGVGEDRGLSATQQQAAIKGVLGMMRFGDHRSPVLLEALASLLSRGAQGRDTDAKRLAARAYLKASYRVQEPEARKAYRGLAAMAIRGQTTARGDDDPVTLRDLEQALQAELKAAEAFAAKVQADEARWIAEGIDVDTAFWARYGKGPEGPDTVGP